MTPAEVKAYANELLNKRVEEAGEALDNMKTLKNIFVQLHERGFHKGADAFRNHVYMILIGNPNLTELQVIEELKKDCDFLQ